MIKLFLISLILVAFVFLALGVKLLIDKKARFTAGSCSGSDALSKKGIECSCGGHACVNTENVVSKNEQSF